MNPRFLFAFLLTLSSFVFATAAQADTGHGRQVGVRAALVTGYNMVLRYDDSPLCRAYDPAKAPDEQVKFCGHGAPLAIDLGLSFAPLDFIEPYVWARFGLAREVSTGTKPVILLGLGARLYTMSSSRFKIYVDPAIAIALEGGIENSPAAAAAGLSDGSYKKDLVFHLAAGPQFDFTEHVGIFADGGLTVGVLRSLHASLELRAGVQARFP